MTIKTKFITNPEPINSPLAVSVKQFEAAVGVGHTKAYELIRDGAVESFTIGTKRLVLVRSIVRFVEKLAKTAAEDRSGPKPRVSDAKDGSASADVCVSTSARRAKSTATNSAT